MFATDKESLLTVISKMQREHCAYDMGPSHHNHPPSFCDCKYGYKDGRGGGGEGNGCPELRLVKELLFKLTNEEYTEILKRKETMVKNNE